MMLDLGWGIAIGAKYKFTDSLQAMIDYSHVKGDSKFCFIPIMLLM
jgi:opacity protein-like surface antigen